MPVLVTVGEPPVLTWITEAVELQRRGRYNKWEPVARYAFADYAQSVIDKDPSRRYRIVPVSC